MTQKTKNISIRTWLADVRALVGDGYLQKTFGARNLKSFQRTIQHWTNKSQHEVEPRRNPIETLSVLLEHLKTQPGGRKLTVRYAVMIAKLCGGTFAPNQNFKPEKSIEEECLEDYPELVALHSLIKHDAEMEEIEFQENEVIREIQETVETVKYSRDLA